MKKVITILFLILALFSCSKKEEITKKEIVNSGSQIVQTGVVNQTGSLVQTGVLINSGAVKTSSLEYKEKLQIKTNTYKNEKYAFQFEYPENLNITSNGDLLYINELCEFNILDCKKVSMNISFNIINSINGEKKSNNIMDLSKILNPSNYDGNYNTQNFLKYELYENPNLSGGYDYYIEIGNNLLKLSTDYKGINKYINSIIDSISLIGKENSNFGDLNYNGTTLTKIL